MRGKYMYQIIIPTLQLARIFRELLKIYPTNDLHDVTPFGICSNLTFSKFCPLQQGLKREIGAQLHENENNQSYLKSKEQKANYSPNCHGLTAKIVQMIT